MQNSFPAFRPLSELDQVPWADLDHAYGSAEDIPDQLRAVAQDDEEAFSECFGNLWHQGTIYSATAQAIPFLNGLVNEGDTRLLFLLGCMAQGSGYLQAHSIPQNSNELEAHAQESEWVEATYDALAAGVEVYLPYLQHEDPDARGQTAHLLSNIMEERWIPSVKPILKQLKREKDPIARASLAWSLWNAPMQKMELSRKQVSYLVGRGEISPSPPEPEVVQALQQVFEQPDQPVLPKLTVALSLAHQRQADAPPEVAEFLKKVIAEEELEELYEELPWDAQIDIYYELPEVARALGKSEEFARCFLEQRHQEHLPWFDIALKLAYPFQSSPITPLVREILNFAEFGKYPNPTYILRDHGLPHTPETLAAFLAQDSS